MEPQVTAAVIHRIALHPLSIPLRHHVARAGTRRNESDSVVVAVDLINGVVGYGETTPRGCITRETAESVGRDVQEELVPGLIGFHPESFPEALEAIEALPFRGADDRLICTARAAVELALLDAAMRTFQRSVDDVVQWMGLPGFGSHGSLGHIRFAGVLAEDDAASTMRRLRLMYWGGLRSFKLTVGFPGDADRLRRVARYLSRPLASGRASLRIDADGRWSKDAAIEWLTDTQDIPITAVEQPLARGSEEDVRVLRDLFDISVVHDESLVTAEDGHRLLDLGVADGFNIRISKCGGLIPSLRLASLARRSDTLVQLGCDAGETSVLSAAGLRFLQVCPGVRCAEGCFGSFLLKGDVVARGLRFGYGGRPPRLRGAGLGIDVDPERLRRLCSTKPIVINL